MKNLAIRMPFVSFQFHFDVHYFFFPFSLAHAHCFFRTHSFIEYCDQSIGKLFLHRWVSIRRRQNVKYGKISQRFMRCNALSSKQCSVRQRGFSSRLSLQRGTIALLFTLFALALCYAVFYWNTIRRMFWKIIIAMTKNNGQRKTG